LKLGIPYDTIFKFSEEEVIWLIATESALLEKQQEQTQQR